MRTHGWALLLVFVGLTTSVGASAQVRMTDQLFGISYDPDKVHFDKMPPVLAQKCPRLQGRYVAAWVYGHFKTPDSEYFLISGLMEFQEDKPGGARTIAPEEGDGLVVVLRGSQCLVDDAGYFLMQEVNPGKTATPIMVPASVLTGILQDSFRRYVIAFGEKQEFLKRVKPSAALPFVREQFEIFAKDPS
jgi:hypothetical protein